MLSPNP
jgi:pentatricopeptide repeat protein